MMQSSETRERSDRVQEPTREAPAAQATEGAGGETGSSQPAGPIEQAAEAAPAADLAAELGSVTAERDQLKAEKAELYDRLLRRTAEFENFRRRVDRERSEMAAFAGMETVRELLPILDDFERSLKVDTSDREFARGMELIYQRFFEVLRRMGLEPIESVGKRFDPYLHHAIERVERPDAEDETVIDELQRGYNFKGRLLRPAMVKVEVRP